MSGEGLIVTLIYPFFY